MLLASRTAPEAGTAATAMAFAKLTAPIHERLDLVTEELGALATPEKKSKTEFKEHSFSKEAVSSWLDNQGGEELVTAFLKQAGKHSFYEGSQIWAFIKIRGIKINIIHLGNALDPTWAVTTTAARSIALACFADADREALGLAPIG